MKNYPLVAFTPADVSLAVVAPSATHRCQPPAIFLRYPPEMCGIIVDRLIKNFGQTEFPIASIESDDTRFRIRASLVVPIPADVTFVDQIGEEINGPCAVIVGGSEVIGVEALMPFMTAYERAERKLLLGIAKSDFSPIGFKTVWRTTIDGFSPNEAYQKCLDEAMSTVLGPQL